MPFASHLAMSIGFFAGIVPAVIILFMTLKEYETYYEDKHFFFLLFAGLLGGTMVALMYYWSIYYLATNFTLFVLLSIVLGFAICEALLFTIILSMKRFGGKYDLTYYGVVMGGAIGGVLVMFSFYVYLTANEISTGAIISMALTIPAIPLAYISIGAMIGYGLFRGELLKYAGWVLFLKSIFNFLFLFWLIAFWYWVDVSGWEWMLICLIFAGLIYLYVTRELMPDALPENLRKHRRRAKRKRRRK